MRETPGAVDVFSYEMATSQQQYNKSSQDRESLRLVTPAFAEPGVHWLLVMRPETEMFIRLHVLLVSCLFLSIASGALAQNSTVPKKVPSAASQQEACGDPCGKATAWEDFNSFTLKLAVPDHPDYSLWQGNFDRESGDIQLDVEHSRSGSVRNGKILMIGERVPAIQGPIVNPGRELDALDLAVLQLQLVMKLLGRALPNGPASVQSVLAIDYSDKKVGIQIATVSAKGMIQPPWHVIGELKRVQSDAIQYTLALTRAVERESSKEKWEKTTIFEGELFNAANTKIDDQLSLESWSLFGAGVQSRKQQGSTIPDDGESPAATICNTVADVRKKLEAESYVGESDPSKDFTGFWKTDCAYPVGLQIKRFDTDGKYSVVFCTPRGCGDPASEGMRTFITKDSHYQVVSEDELKIQSAVNHWDTYHRCTRDTQPLLNDKKP